MVTRVESRGVWLKRFAGLYGGLRRGELQALSWDDVDWPPASSASNALDVQEGLIEPKSRAARRKVPIPAILRDYLVEHRHGLPGVIGHVFGRRDGRPFDGPTVDARAKAAWREAGLEPITLHEGRHTFASHMVAAGVNAKLTAMGT